jgi:hypothetical protein
MSLFGESHNSSSGSSSSGALSNSSLWHAMCQLTAQPEVNEVKRIVGVTLIDSNEVSYLHFAVTEHCGCSLIGGLRFR